MISSNLISLETSSATAQGLTGKKGKGSSQTKSLFSNLLNILQKGKEQAGKKGLEALTHKTSETDALAKSKKESIPQALSELKGKKSKFSQDVTQPNISGEKTAVTKHKSNQNIRLTESALKGEVKNKKAPLEADLKNKDGSDMIAVVQESTFIPQQHKNTVSPGNESPVANLTLGKKQNKQNPSSFSQQSLQGKSASYQQSPTLLNNSEPPTQQISPKDSALTSFKQTTQTDKTSKTNEATTVFQSNMSLEASKQQGKKAVTQDSQSIANQSQVTQTNKNTQAAGLNIEANITKPESNISLEGGKQQTNKNTQAVGLNIEANITKLEPNIAATKQSTDEDAQHKDATKVVQTPIATPQRVGNQNQALQNNVPIINSNASAMGTATSDNNSASSQQDFGSQQSGADITLLDAGKVDSKPAKGLDFQAQLAYKSQSTFTPADTMLEIVRSAKTGKTSLELQLEPANLGKVQVSIQMDNAKHIQVIFTVDQNASRHALEQQMPQLRIALAQQGLDLSGFSMQMNQQGGGQQEQSESAKNAHADTNINNTSPLTTNDEQQTRIGVNLATHGHLSILA